MCGWVINSCLGCFLCLYFSPGCCRLCYPSREELKLIWIAAQTFSNDNGTGYRRYILRDSSWYLVWVWGWYRSNKCLWRWTLRDLSLTGGRIRTRNDPCKVWLKRTGVLLQFLVNFHFKREVLCITNQEGMLRGSTLPLKEWKHGYHFPFPSHGIIYQGVQLQAEAQGCLVSHWPLLLLFLLGSFLVFFLCHFICDSVSWEAWELHIFLLSPYSFRLSWGIWWSHVQKAKLLSWWPFVLRLMWWRKKSMWGQLGREAGSCLCFVILLNVMGSVALPFRSKGWWLLTSCTCSSVEAAAVIVEIVGIAYGKWKV